MENIFQYVEFVLESMELTCKPTDEWELPDHINLEVLDVQAEEMLASVQPDDYDAVDGVLGLLKQITRQFGHNDVREFIMDISQGYHLKALAQEMSGEDFEG